MVKSENYVLFENCCGHWPQSWFKHLDNELMKLKSIKGQGHYLTLAKGHSDYKIKTCFSQKLLNYLELNFI